jgi:putative membrane protein
MFIRTFSEVCFIRSEYFHALCGNANLLGQDVCFWHNSSGTSGITGMNVKYLLIFLLMLVVVVISITLGAHNDQVVTFNYLLAQGDYRVSTLLAVLFATGFILGWVICGLFYLRVRLSLRRAQRKIKRLEQQIAPVPAVVTPVVPSAASKE